MDDKVSVITKEVINMYSSAKKFKNIVDISELIVLPENLKIMYNNKNLEVDNK